MSLLMLTLLKYFLLALIYLFLFFILLTIWSDIKNKEKRARRGRLTGLEGPFSGQSFTFSDSISIGRSPSNNLIIDDQYVSLSHALISKKKENFLIQDLNTTNGTYLNGVRIHKPVVLKNGDSIKVGRSVFQFMQEK